MGPGSCLAWAWPGFACSGSGSMCKCQLPTMHFEKSRALPFAAAAAAAGQNVWRPVMLASRATSPPHYRLPSFLLHVLCSPGASGAAGLPPRQHCRHLCAAAAAWAEARGAFQVPANQPGELGRPSPQGGQRCRRRCMRLRCMGKHWARGRTCHAVNAPQLHAMFPCGCPCI